MTPLVTAKAVSHVIAGQAVIAGGRGQPDPGLLREVSQMHAAATIDVVRDIGVEIAHCLTGISSTMISTQ